MALDPLNVLDVWPLPGIDEFIDECHGKNVNEINVTGTNTDPLLYKHTEELANYLLEHIPDLILGIRTNGVGPLNSLKEYDKGSITVCSFNEAINKKMMGGPPPLPLRLKEYIPRLKLNIVLGPENTEAQKWGQADVLGTLRMADTMQFSRVNLREPYGQPHVGDPMQAAGFAPMGHIYGMPIYRFGSGLEVTYWDVHYVEVESVNLYASGRVSLTYPITKGHTQDGVVVPQDQFPGGRVQEQWLKV